MDVDDCDHNVLESGICIACGLCFDQTEYADPPFFKTNRTDYKNHTKYTVKNQFKHFNTAIQKILTPLNLESYKPRMIELLNTTKFTSRLSKEDKVLVALYHLLLQDGFPITVSDILLYTKMSKYRLLKAYRDTFEYNRLSVAYLRAIYYREFSFVTGLGIPTSFSFEDFAEYMNHHTSASPADLCVACMIKFATAPYVFRTLNIAPRSYKEKIRKLLKKCK